MKVLIIHVSDICNAFFFVAFPLSGVFQKLKPSVGSGVRNKASYSICTLFYVHLLYQVAYCYLVWFISSSYTSRL
jgi:hypothetical protein